jgi:hypothetical protein
VDCKDQGVDDIITMRNNDSYKQVAFLASADGEQQCHSQLAAS